jgi:hypothetical protein
MSLERALAFLEASRAERDAEIERRAEDARREQARLEQELLRSKHSARQTKLLAAMAVLLLLGVIAALTLGPRVWALFDQNAANHIAQEASISGSVTGAALDATAFQKYDDPATRSALLAGLEKFDGLHHASVPPWRTAAFANKGEQVAVLTLPTATAPAALIVLNTLDLTFNAARESALPRGRFLCGFRDSTQFAVADRTRLAVSDAMGPIGSGFSKAAGADISAIACPNQNTGVLVAFTDGRVAAFQPKSQRTTWLARRSSYPAVAIAVSKSGKSFALLALDGRAEVFRNAQHVSEIVPQDKKRRLDTRCSELDCSQSVAFDPDEKQIAWQDGNLIRVASYDLATQTQFACAPCEIPEREAVAIAYLYGDTPPTIILPRGVAEVIAGSHIYDMIYSIAADRKAPLPVHNMDLNVFVSWTKNGIATHAREEDNAPLLDEVAPPAQFFMGDFALIGDSLRYVRTDDRATDYLSLPTLRRKAVELDMSDDVELFDAGDGAHAASFNYHNGQIKVYEFGNPEVKTPGQAICTASGARTCAGGSAEIVQLGYDPATHIVTEASRGGVIRWTLSGERLSSRPWSSFAPPALAKRAGGAGCSAALLGATRLKPVCNPSYRLSTRGNYVTFVSDPRTDSNEPAQYEVHSTAAVPRTIKTSQYGLWVSSDEQYVFAVDKVGPDSIIRSYRLADTAKPAFVDVGGTTPVAVSPDGRMLAYVTNAADGARRVQLLDLNSQELLGPPLPAIPDAVQIRDLRFSLPDGRYLVASARTVGLSNSEWLAVYTVSPESWLRWLCLIGGRQPEGSEACKPFPHDSYPGAPQS